MQAWLWLGHVVRKHIVPAATKCTLCRKRSTGPCDLRTTLSDDLTYDRRTTITSGKAADWRGFEGQGKSFMKCNMDLYVPCGKFCEKGQRRLIVAYG